MKKIFIFFFCFPMITFGQQDSVVIPEPAVVDLQFLITEALVNNPEIQAALQDMSIRESRVAQESALSDPELRFMQEAMPDFHFNEAMYSRLDLMQTIPFPSKLGLQSHIAELESDHAHHDHLEKMNAVIRNLKIAYDELWLAQQQIILEHENERLMKQYLAIAQIKYGNAQSSQQDVLKAQIELSMIENDIVTFRQKELSAKAMLASLLNRQPNDTLGYAVIPEEVIFNSGIDTLITIALQNRPMLVHDSLVIDESQTMYSLATQQYLPDFTFGLEHITSPLTGFHGWSVSVGMTLPFAPWTLGKSNARVEEATASIHKSQDLYASERNMVTGNIKNLFYKVSAAKQQLGTYASSILPQAQEALQTSLVSYQTGRTDFLMLLDAYRSRVSLINEYFMTRMQFEQTIAELEFEVGTQNISDLK